MSLDIEILAPTDRPVLLGIGAADILDYAQGVLDQLGYKVHTATTKDEFLDRFSRVQYEIILLEDTFGGVPPDQNESLQTLQQMPMAQRPFHQSVHATINRNDLHKLMLIIQQVVNDHTLFLNTYRDVQRNIAQGKR